MLKKTEETIGFFVMFLSLVKFHFWGTSASPPLAYAYAPSEENKKRVRKFSREVSGVFHRNFNCSKNSAVLEPRTSSSSSSYLFIYQVTSYHKKKTATSSRSITKASKYAIPLKPNTQTCRVKAIFSHLVRRQRRTERSSKSTATSPS